MMLNELLCLKGKTALVTGGGQGIGRSICLMLAEQGADVIINYRSNKEKAERTNEDIKRFGVKSWLWEYDLNCKTLKNDFSRFCGTISQSPDILILNASIQIRKDWDKVTSEDFENQINVNLKASLELIQSCVPYMEEKKWGRILTLGSVQQNRPSRQMIVYAASKAAQLNMVKNLAWTLGGKGITINNLAPGVIATSRNEEVLSNDTFKENFCKKIPLGYIGEPQDVAPMALLLCSDAGRYITGTDIFVDGGLSLPE